MRTLLFTVGLTLGLAVSQATAAEPARETGRFDVYVLGLKAGELTYGMAEEGGQYAATGRVRSSGLIAAFADFRYETSVKGAVVGGRYQPRVYNETIRSSKRDDDTEIRYRAGVPVPQDSDKRKDHWLDPATQKGTLDPMTAFWQLLRDRAGDDLCKLDVTSFDGQRRVRMVTSGAKRSSDRVTCKGRYIREGGFSDDQLKEGREFSFTLSYAPGGARWQVSRIEAQTLRGRALLIRR